MKPIKIAYVIDSIQTTTAGTESQLIKLLEGIDNSEFKPYLICLSDSEWLQNYKPPFPKIILNIDSLLSFKFITGLFKLIRFFKKEKIDIVQTFFFDTNIFGVVSARLAGIKYIIAGRRTLGYWHNSKILFILRCLSKWTTHYIANSHAVADYAILSEKIKPEKFEIIHNGLDTKLYEIDLEKMRKETRERWKISENETLIGIVSNLRPVKNIGIFINAAIELLKENSNLRFITIGEGPEREALLKKINSHNYSEKIEIIGNIKNVLTIIPAFDIAVFTSTSEGLSNTVLEYMACGLPIVASDIDSNKELITHQETGLLFRSNDLDDLISCIDWILSNKEEAVRLGKNAKKVAFSKFNIENYILNHKSFYKKLLEK